MAEPRPLLRLAARRIGAVAGEVLADGGDGEVIAVYERSFYLACPAGIVCIGTDGIGAGPINVEAVLPAGYSWAGLGIAREVPARIEDGGVTIGEVVRLAIAAASVWLPPAMPRFDRTTASAGLAALARAANTKMPGDGLAALVLAPATAAARTPTASAAAGPVQTLAAGLPGVLASGTWTAECIRAATLLVGLGPGLTPSGDDLLGGLMLALSALDAAGLRNALWHMLEPELADLTVAISAMHLAAAGDGMAAEAVHLLVNAVLTNSAAAIPARLAGVASIGHTSGWDMVAGFHIGLAAGIAALPGQAEPA